MSWPLVWVAVGLIALVAGCGIATILLLSAPAASGRGPRPLISSALSGSAACAPTDRAPVDSTRAGSRATLVPPGANALLLCRYGPGGKKVLERSITQRATISRLGWELNALPSAKGAYNCPSDDGESITADFSYASGAENPVSVGLSGCQSATNGHVDRLGLDHPVIGQLDQLVPWLGTIAGRLKLCGGPAPGRCSTSSYGACSGSRCFTADQVGIEHARGAQYPNVRVRRGRFTVRVEPGRYRLVLYGDGRHVHGKVLEAIRVRVRLGHTTRAVFEISIS